MLPIVRPLGRTLVSIAVARGALGLFVLVAFRPESRVSIAICLLAMGIAQLSDHLDGWLVRRYSTPSVAGYLQDSVADKLFHLGCLLALARYYEWVSVFIWIVCAREFLVLAIRIVVADVRLALQRFRLQSIAYAVAMRITIAGAFLSTFIVGGRHERIDVWLLYGALSILGIVGGGEYLFAAQVCIDHTPELAFA